MQAKQELVEVKFSALRIGAMFTAPGIETVYVKVSATQGQPTTRERGYTERKGEPLEFDDQDVLYKA